MWQHRLCPHDFGQSGPILARFSDQQPFVLIRFKLPMPGQWERKHVLFHERHLKHGYGRREHHHELQGLCCARRWLLSGGFVYRHATKPVNSLERDPLDRGRLSNQGRHRCGYIRRQDSLGRPRRNIQLRLDMDVEGVRNTRVLHELRTHHYQGGLRLQETLRKYPRTLRRPKQLPALGCLQHG